MYNMTEYVYEYIKYVKDRWRKRDRERVDFVLNVRNEIFWLLNDD